MAKAKQKSRKRRDVQPENKAVRKKQPPLPDDLEALITQFKQKDYKAFRRRFAKGKSLMRLRNSSN